MIVDGQTQEHSEDILARDIETHLDYSQMPKGMTQFEECVAEAAAIELPTGTTHETVRQAVGDIGRRALSNVRRVMTGERPSDPLDVVRGTHGYMYLEEYDAAVKMRSIHHGAQGEYVFSEYEITNLRTGQAATGTYGQSQIIEKYGYYGIRPPAQPDEYAAALGLGEPTLPEDDPVANLVTQYLANREPRGTVSTADQLQRIQRLQGLGALEQVDVIIQPHDWNEAIQILPLTKDNQLQRIKTTFKDIAERTVTFPDGTSPIDAMRDVLTLQEQNAIKFAKHLPDNIVPAKDPSVPKAEQAKQAYAGLGSLVATVLNTRSIAGERMLNKFAVPAEEDMKEAYFNELLGGLDSHLVAKYLEDRIDPHQTVRSAFARLATPLHGMHHYFKSEDGFDKLLKREGSAARQQRETYYLIRGAFRQY